MILRMDPFAFVLNANSVANINNKNEETTSDNGPAIVKVCIVKVSRLLSVSLSKPSEV